MNVTLKGGTADTPINEADLRSAIKYTSTGCEIMYEEIGDPSERFRIELEKADGKLITRKIYEGSDEYEEAKDQDQEK